MLNENRIESFAISNTTINLDKVIESLLFNTKLQILEGDCYKMRNKYSVNMAFKKILKINSHLCHIEGFNALTRKMRCKLLNNFFLSLTLQLKCFLIALIDIRSMTTLLPTSVILRNCYQLLKYKQIIPLELKLALSKIIGYYSNPRANSLNFSTTEYIPEFVFRKIYPDRVKDILPSQPITFGKSIHI